jgi:hypothetical protein
VTETFRMAFIALLNAGEYKLAFRVFVLRYKTIRLHQATLRHNHKHDKLKKKTDALTNDLRAFAFGQEVEIFSAGWKMEDLK